MKRLIAIVLSLCVLLLPLQARRRWIPRMASAPTYADIIYYWGMESGTWSNAEKATGSGTGTPVGTALASIVTVKVGTHSLSILNAGDYVSFSPTSNFSFSAGGAGLWFYASSAFGNFGGIMRVAYSGDQSNNQMYMSTTSAGLVNWAWVAGSTGVAFRTTTGTAMTTGNWYWIQCLHNGTSFVLTVFNSAGTAIQTDSTTGTLGTLAGALDQFYIGDDSGNESACFIDNVLVTNDGTRNLQLINTGTSF